MRANRLWWGLRSFMLLDEGMTLKIISLPMSLYHILSFSFIETFAHLKNTKIVQNIFFIVFVGVKKRDKYKGFIEPV